jgi:hypothetical protein
MILMDWEKGKVDSDPQFTFGRRNSLEKTYASENPSNVFPAFMYLD